MNLKKSIIMNPEIEKLMNIALQDGVITDKEREILLRKCEQFGMDKDEFEMILEGKLHELNQKQQKTSVQSNKHGDIKKCPSCNAQVPSFSTKCPDCGYEFRNIEANKSVTELSKKLDEIVTEVNKMSFSDNSKSLQGMLSSTKDIDRKREEELERRQEQIIINFPIPNTREDILELLQFIFPKINVDNEIIAEAWQNKLTEVVSRAKTAYSNDNNMLNEIAFYEDKLNTKVKKTKRNNLFLGIGIAAFFIFLGVMFFMLAQSSNKGIEKEKARLETLMNEINVSISSKDFKTAELKCAQLNWEYSSSWSEDETNDLKKAWDEKRTELLNSLRNTKDSIKK